MTDRQKNNFAIAHPNHAGKSCNKFGSIPPSGLGGGSVRADARTDGRTDGKIMYLLLHTLTTRASHEASLVKFCPVV